MFCRYNALGVKNAITPREMGLAPPTMIQRLTGLRDHKPYALQLLHQDGIAHVTEDGKLYMTEEKLNENMRCRVVWEQICVPHQKRTIGFPIGDEGEERGKEIRRGKAVL